jgi:hypothetical protein
LPPWPAIAWKAVDMNAGAMLLISIIHGRYKKELSNGEEYEVFGEVGKWFECHANNNECF